MKEEKMVMTLSLDTSLLGEKVDQLTALLKARFPDGLPDSIDSHLLSLCDDIVFVERSTTVVAGSRRKFIQRVDFGESFDVLTAAIRAGDFDVHA